MRNGYKVMDSDIHVIEPPDLWQRYLDPEFRDRAPSPPEGSKLIRWEVDGRALPAYSDTPERLRGLQIRYRPERVGDAERPRDARTGTTPEAMLAAMEVEGIDVSVVFRTYGAHVIAFDDMDPAFEAALCRAFNRWLAEFCSAERARLKLGAQIPLLDVEHAVAEAHFAVRELGATTLVLPSQLVAVARSTTRTTIPSGRRRKSSTSRSRFTEFSRPTTPATSPRATSTITPWGMRWVSPSN